MSNVAIRVEGLGKQYRIGSKQERYKTFRDTVTQAAFWPLRMTQSLIRRDGRHRGTNESFWALKDVSFEIKHGEAVGIIGRNGAGKSTLLKILSRITEPTEGYADIYGRVGSLLEVGTGFHPELTGRENIYLNGAILGMRRIEIDRRFDEIVAFAEIEKFIDTPVKHYSSGMGLRLGFAVAAHLEPEILVVDEVLAVGDATFQKKCLGKMDEVAGAGRTVLFVSHNMAAVSALCSRAVWLDNGGVKLEGETSIVVGRYLSLQVGLTSIPLGERLDRTGNGRLRFTRLRFHNCDTGIESIASGQGANIVLEYESSNKAPIHDVQIAIVFIDTYGQRLFTCSTEHHSMGSMNIPSSGELICSIEHFPLLPGRYTIQLWSSVKGQAADRVENAGLIEVEEYDFFGSGKLPNVHKHGPFLVQHTWSIS